MSSMQAPLTQLAVSTCDACKGTGIRRGPTAALCGCVCRAVFRRCYFQFRRCVLSAGSTQLVSLEGRIGPSNQRHYTWVRRNEDYVADFEMAARQSLSPELHRLFRWHYLLGASASLLCHRLHRNRWFIEHSLDEIQAAMGRHIAGSAPYSIYPPSQYMQSSSQMSIA